MRSLILASLLVASLGASGVRAAEPAAGEADQAWVAIEASGAPPQVPEAWRTTQPTQAEIEKFRAEQAQRFTDAAQKAKEFYAKYPDNANAAAARRKEYEWVVFAMRLGNTNLAERAEAIEATLVKDPKLGDEERLELRTRAIQRAAEKKMDESREAAMAEYERGVRALIVEFPKRPEPYVMLIQLAGEYPAEKARAMAKEVIDGTTEEQPKEAAMALLKKLDALGKPVAIKFTALDGREVDLAKLQGKVVLLDFWATWCGPCVAEMPKVKAAYEKLHPKGFEIVGLSFDKDKDQLLRFVEREKIEWPQYFDGQGWENKLGKEFGIQSIPTMWLLNKKGLLVDMSGRDGLAEKVEKLLAE